MSNNNLFPTLTRWAILMVLVAAGLLLVAGTTHLPMLNAYIVALAPSLLVMMLTIAPQIAQERGSADGGKHDLHDLKARLALVVLFLVTIVGSSRRGPSALVQPRTPCPQRNCAGDVYCGLGISSLGDEREFFLLAGHSRPSRTGA